MVTHLGGSKEPEPLAPRSLTISVSLSSSAERSSLFPISSTVLLHQDLGALGELRALRLNSNKLRTVPRTISWMTQLTELNLARNSLVDVPSEVGKLRSLLRCDLSRQCEVANPTTQPQTLHQMTLNPSPYTLDVNPNPRTPNPKKSALTCDRCVHRI